MYKLCVLLESCLSEINRSELLETLKAVARDTKVAAPNLSYVILDKDDKIIWFT